MHAACSLQNMSNLHCEEVLEAHGIRPTAVRILVLSARPGSIRTEIPLDFSGETSPIRRRNLPEFSKYFNQVWKEMQSHES